MTMLEDRVRRALRETAEEISPLDVPPLRLGQTAGRGQGGSGRLPRSRRTISWPGWLTPLAAAAAVAAVLAASLALTGTLPGHRPAHRGQPARPLPGVPRYYVVLAPTPHGAWPQQAEVRATATSQTVATLAVPAPYNVFIMVAAAADVGRYVLAAQRTEVQQEGNVKIAEPVGPVRFYQFWISSSGQVSSLRPLPVPEVPAGPSLAGLALTPDGRKLAVALETPKPGRNPEIEVDTLATGAQRVWTWPGAQPIEESLGGTGAAVSWAADDRTLAFQRLIGSKIQVRLLDTAAPGSSLAASRVALSRFWDGSSHRFRHGRSVNDIMTFGTLLTPDGSKIVCATDTETQQPPSAELAFTEFSAQTGKVVAVLGRWQITGHWPTEEQDVLWTNADGSTLLVAAHQPGATASAQGNFRIQFGVQHGNHYTPLPGAPGPNRLSVWPAW
jgi:hypothetical protein